MTPSVPPRFVSIPVDVPYAELVSLARSYSAPGETLSDTLHRLETEGFNMPFQVSLPVGPWAERTMSDLEQIISGDVMVRRQVGSAAVSEWLSRRLRKQPSSGVFSEFRPIGASMFSPGVSSRGAKRGKGFWFAVNAELVTPRAAAMPTRFPRTLSELDLHLAGEGRHEELYEKLGAHPGSLHGVDGCAFAVWAPNARSVSVVGDFNGWDGRVHQLRSLGGSGVWEVFVPGAGEGAHYKFEIRGQDGELRLKVDPLAFAAERPPKTASVVFRSRHEWADGEWMERRAESDPWHGPMSVYEVHLGSWRLNPLEGSRQLSYAELGEELASYATDLGFTHVELGFSTAFKPPT